MRWFLKRTAVALTLLAGIWGIAWGTNYTMTQGAGTTFGSIVVTAVNYPQMLLCDLVAPAQCAAVSAGGAVSVAGPVTNAGTFATQLTGATNNINNIAGTVTLPTGAATSALQTTGNTSLTTINTTLGTPFQAGGSLAANQSINNAQINGVAPLMGNGVTGTGSQRVTIASDNTAFAVSAAATLAAETTKVIGTVRNVGNVGGVFDFVGQAATAPANATLTGATFFTTPTTLTNGQASPLQMDSAGNLLVNIKAGAGSGGTAITDKAAWTVSSTNFTLMGGEFTTGGATACTTGQACTAGMTAARAFFNDLSSQAGTAITSAPSAYGTPPTGNVIGVNAFVTNTNANGSNTAANSSPVVLASNQTAADACMFQNKTNLAISQNGTASVQLIALSGATVIYVCSLSLIAAGATTVAITTGTGSACVTGNAAVIGTTTANIANSISLAANGGLTLGNGGGTIAKGAASSELCMVLGTSVFVSGNLTYVQL